MLGFYPDVIKYRNANLDKSRKVSSTRGLVFNSRRDCFRDLCTRFQVRGKRKFIYETPDARNFHNLH